MKNQTETKRGEAPREAGAKLPDKPRDCGPHVDTWPILDTQAGDAPKTKAGESGE